MPRGKRGEPEAIARLVLPWMFSAEYLADEGRRERTARGLAATAARVPASTLVRAAAGMRRWIPGAGHAVTFEAPAAVTDAIRAQFEAG